MWGNSGRGLGRVRLVELVGVPCKVSLKCLSGECASALFIGGNACTQVKKRGDM